MIKLITYTDDRMTISAEYLRQSALRFGADEVKIYTPADLPAEFKEKMKDVLAQERGAGYYCWKPLCCLDAISTMGPDNFLIWADAGTEIVAPLRHLTEAMDDDILFFSNGFWHKEWCKMDLLAYCFPALAKPDEITVGWDPALVMEAKQVQASHIVFKGVNNAIRLVAHWATLAEIPHLVDNSPSELPNVPTFAEHRWDQSILCCLQIMYGYKLHWFPTTTAYHIKSGYPGDHYPAIFNHHRKRNNEWKTL